MKLRRVAIANVRSFLGRQELHFPGPISILIGPNGGGKTNVLDVVSHALRVHLLKSWTPRRSPNPTFAGRSDWVTNDALRANALEKHSRGQALPQSIELELEVTGRDVENMNRTKNEAPDLEERAKARYTSFPPSGAAQWDLNGVEPGTAFTFRITDGALEAPSSPAAASFRSYLETYEVNRRLREESAQEPLSTPMLSLPAHRSAGGVAAATSLAHYVESDLKVSVDAASSRAVGSITGLAIGRMASRLRFLLENDNGKATVTFASDPSNKGLTDTLSSLGYS